MSTKAEKDLKNKDLKDKVKLYAEEESKKVFDSTVVTEENNFTTIVSKDNDSEDGGVTMIIKRAE